LGELVVVVPEEPHEAAKIPSARRLTSKVMMTKDFFKSAPHFSMDDVTNIILVYIAVALSCRRRDSRVRGVKRVLRWMLKSWPMIAVVVASLVGLILWPVLSRPPADLGVQHQARINEIMYPTFGNPAIIVKGSALRVEFDPRNRDFGASFIKMKKFVVSAQTSNGAYPIILRLPVTSFRAGTSSQWPEYAGEDRRIYLVDVTVPPSAPVDLYNLTVSGQIDATSAITDKQPHALQAVDQYKDHFSFCQLTDIHVFGPECIFGSAVYHDRGERQNGGDPGRTGAVYYQKAISEMNLMKPDFCVFTGDYMFGESYFLKDQGDPWGETTEYEYEMLWFYQETMKLDVPVFMILGNHDSLSEDHEAAHEDWFENWRRLFGPLYHSFDYGDYHFLALNSQDWPVRDRTLVDYDIAIQTEKYKGQFSKGGDRWAKGVSTKRLEAIDEKKFGGQLKWMKDDLASHQDSKMRVVLTHQDPWRKAGSGTMWASAGSDSTGFFGKVKSVLGFGGIYGNGAGRLAAVKLMSQYKVALELSGHFHSDNVEKFPWADGTGECVCANTTCTQFNVDGLSNSYPGYRRIWVSNGKLESYNYKDPKWSYPLYAGTNVGGTTDLSKLEAQAIASTVSPPPGDATDVTLTIGNSLIKPLPDACAEFPMPYVSGSKYYRVIGGRLGESQDTNNSNSTVPGRKILQVYTDVRPQEVKSVRVVLSSSADTEAPSGSMTINNGGPIATSRDVMLHIIAADSGGSGLDKMMISNSPDFQGAEWETYRRSVIWRLADGDSGPRTVYVKFEDNAMPPNISAPAAASVSYVKIDI
jgi:predicted MPP superfamily phosphohydrolase